MNDAAISSPNGFVYLFKIRLSPQFPKMFLWASGVGRFRLERKYVVEALPLFTIEILQPFEPKAVGLRQTLTISRSQSLALLPTCRLDRVSRESHRMKTVVYDLVVN
jgi:hypothetical protein